MKRYVEVFNNKYPLLGPVIFVMTIEYYVVQLIVGINFKPSYSIGSNTISDLGNTRCSLYGGRVVCSPDHTLMNISFFVLGLIMVIGSILLMQEFGKIKRTTIGFYMLMFAGLGSIIVGLFPENTVSAFHIFGAALAFIFGNVGIILISSNSLLPTKVRAYGFILGGIGLLGLILFMSKIYLGLGEGGMERITAYPQSIWLIIFGIYMFHACYKKINT
jgi:hypothetical membrane protein